MHQGHCLRRDNSFSELVLKMPQEKSSSIFLTFLPIVQDDGMYIKTLQIPARCSFAV